MACYEYQFSVTCEVVIQWLLLNVTGNYHPTCGKKKFSQQNMYFSISESFLFMIEKLQLKH